MILPPHKTFISQLATISVKNFMDNYEKIKESKRINPDWKMGDPFEIPVKNDTLNTPEDFKNPPTL